MWYDMTYAEAVEKADALKTIGQNTIYLYKGELPWSIADDCEPGGSHRLEISTSVRFSGTDPATGLRFEWSFDIEDRSANGKGSYEIDAEGCRKVFAMLGDGCRAKFARYLAVCAEKVQAKGDEWAAITKRQISDAKKLRELAAEG